MSSNLGAQTFLLSSTLQLNSPLRALRVAADDPAERKTSNARRLNIAPLRVILIQFLSSTKEVGGLSSPISPPGLPDSWVQLRCILILILDLSESSSVGVKKKTRDKNKFRWLFGNEIKASCSFILLQVSGFPSSTKRKEVFARSPKIKRAFYYALNESDMKGNSG